MVQYLLLVCRFFYFPNQRVQTLTSINNDFVLVVPSTTLKKGAGGSQTTIIAASHYFCNFRTSDCAYCMRILQRICFCLNNTTSIARFCANVKHILHLGQKRF